MRGDRQVYTPQIVVNGTTHVLGSDRTAIERAIAQTDRNTAIMSAHVLVSVSGGDLNVKVAASKEHLGGEVWLCPLAKSVPIAIGRGENSGHTVIYYNVVRRWLKLGDWTGSDAAWSVPMSDFMTDEVDAAAVMVQQGSREKPGMILGAAFESLGAQTTEVRCRHPTAVSLRAEERLLSPVPPAVRLIKPAQIKRPANSRPLRNTRT